MDISKIKELIELMQEYSVTSLKLGELELYISEHRNRNNIPINDVVVPTKEELSDEDMLFYSVNEPQSNKN